jgi:DNA-binding winged helix-turn-helix (wHTH) protein
MALVKLSVLDNNVRSYASEARQDNRPGLNTQIFGDVLFDNPCPMFLDEQNDRPIAPAPPQNDDDYEVALVLRRNRTRRTRPILQSSTTMDHGLLLQFTWRELLARVRRELNHSGSVEQSAVTRFGEVRFNFLTMEISRSDKPVVLTAQELKLLRFFAQNPKRVFSRNELLNKVWGYNNYPSTRTVDNHICTLRQKLEPTPPRPIHFLTVHGMGYKFVP